MSTTPRHPIQPTYDDENGVRRFRPNKIVQFLLDNGTWDLNRLAMKGFASDEWEQFAQLIGYSLSGFSELSYVTAETCESAHRMSDEEMTENDARVAYLEETVEFLKENMREAVARLFEIHPDDLR
jgi:biotin synthase-related radical SAM superfamily protein